MGTWRCSITTVDEQRYSLVAPPDAGRLDRWLAGEVPLSRSRLQDLIERGCVSVDGEKAKSNFKLRGGEAVEVEIPARPTSALATSQIDVPILFQDEHIIVVDKPAGLVVHPAAGHRDDTLVNALLPALGEVVDDEQDDRPGIVHRLDRGTSGVMVVARTPLAREKLAEQFAAHSADRRYLALVWGAPDQKTGVIDAPLGRHPQDRKRFAVVSGGRRAITRWALMLSARVATPGRGVGVPVSLLECRLETGRTHQVRVHLQHVGLPVVADPLYGRKGPAPESIQGVLDGLDHQLLHARRLGLVHPATGEAMLFESPPPPDFLSVLEWLGLELPPSRA